MQIYYCLYFNIFIQIRVYNFQHTTNAVVSKIIYSLVNQKMHKEFNTTT